MVVMAAIAALSTGSMRQKRSLSSRRPRIIAACKTKSAAILNNRKGQTKDRRAPARVNCLARPALAKEICDLKNDDDGAQQLVPITIKDNAARNTRVSLQLNNETANGTAPCSTMARVCSGMRAIKLTHCAHLHSREQNKSVPSALLTAWHLFLLLQRLQSRVAAVRSRPVAVGGARQSGTQMPTSAFSVARRRRRCPWQPLASHRSPAWSLGVHDRNKQAIPELWPNVKGKRLKQQMGGFNTLLAQPRDDDAWLKQWPTIPKHRRQSLNFANEAIDEKKMKTRAYGQSVAHEFKEESNAGHDALDGRFGRVLGVDQTRELQENTVANKNATNIIATINSNGTPLLKRYFVKKSTKNFNYSAPYHM